jgi:hypothetical protein
MYIDNESKKTVDAAAVLAVLKESAEYAAQDHKDPKHGYIYARRRMTKKALREFFTVAEGCQYSPSEKMAQQFVALNDAIISGRDVFATCEKRPNGSLDKGRHYFNIHFVTPDGHVEMINPRAYGGDAGAAVLHLGSRDNIENGFFSSGAIGMSRLLDATEGVFSLLRRAGGTYVQIDCR